VSPFTVPVFIAVSSIWISPLIIPWFWVNPLKSAFPLIVAVELFTAFWVNSASPIISPLLVASFLNNTSAIIVLSLVALSSNSIILSDCRVPVVDESPANIKLPVTVKSDRLSDSPVNITSWVESTGAVFVEFPSNFIVAFVDIGALFVEFSKKETQASTPASGLYITLELLAFSSNVIPVVSTGPKFCVSLVNTTSPSPVIDKFSSDIYF